jgi:hypothetical protein
MGWILSRRLYPPWLAQLLGRLPTPLLAFALALDLRPGLVGVGAAPGLVDGYLGGSAG